MALSIYLVRIFFCLHNKILQVRKTIYMQFHTQKVELTETLRFSFLPAMSTEVTSSSASQFQFSLHTPVLNVAAVLSQPVTLSWAATKDVNSKFVQHKVTLTQLKKIPLVQLIIFQAETRSGFCIYESSVTRFDPRCRTISGAKMNGNVLFEYLQQQGMVPKKPSFLSFFCPLEGKLTN